MANEPGAVLVAEVGSTQTRVTLVDAVDGEARLIGQASVPSTTEPPHSDASVAILEAAAQIAELTGRRLLEDGNLLLPQTHERDGVNSVLVTTSAAGQMGLVIAAVASDISARSAIHACRATYTTILQMITLNDTADISSDQQNTWVERQVQRLIGLRPDVVMITGGLEGGAQDALVRLAHIVTLTATSRRVDLDGQQRENVMVRPVIYAGNSQGRERIIEALSGKAEPRVVDNVRPTLELERLEPARRELRKQYNERILQQLPGLPALRRLSSRSIRTSCESVGLMTRFIAERDERNVLALDVGSSNTAAQLYSQGRYSPTVLGGVGTGYGLGAVLAERGTAAIMRWLPFPIDEQELTHRLLNKLLRPHIPPSTREELQIEHAVAREALAMALDALWDERAGAPFDLIVAGGGVLAGAPHPGLAALTVLDAVQCSAAEGLLEFDLHLDELGLMAACGTLAFASPDAALTLYERDLLRNTPLAHCIIANGSGRIGERAVEAELLVVGGDKKQLVVNHGQIGRLELPPGSKAQIRLKPFGNVRIGNSAPGAEVASDVAAMRGSTLGVLIDARGRPFHLPQAPQDRQNALWEWLVALGVERGALPYEIGAPLPEAPTEPVPVHTSSEELVEEPLLMPIPPDAPEIENELAQLRQTVEKPKKKRGLFGRK